jgi:hypothetical protein
MSDTPARLPGGPANGDRLNGWKDIAGHLGKSVRTAQRWEQELHLPVRRIHTASGEIVYALRHELDAWLERVGDARPGDAAQPAEADPTSIAAAPNGAAPPAAPRYLRAWIAAAIGLVIVAAGGLAIYLIVGVRPPTNGAGDRSAVTDVPGRPARWKADGNRLIVLDDSNRQLWDHRFDFPLKEDAYGPLGDAGRTTVIVTDLDGDGRPEVLVMTVPAYVVAETHVAERCRLVCFNGDGSLRFEYLPATPVKFGDDEYGPPFGVNRVLTTDNGDGTRTVWITASHSQMFPTVLQKLDPQGRMMGEFWCNGHLTLVEELTLDNRRVMALGGTDNGLMGGSLTFVDYHHPTGSTPARDGPYRCTSCPEGQPLAYFVFPQMDTARVAGRDRPFVREIRVEPDGRMRVTVSQGGKIIRPPEAPALVFYTLGPDLRVLSAEIGDDFRRIHAELEHSGLLKHPVGPQDEAALFPVLRWSGRGFVKIKKPQ